MSSVDILGGGNVEPRALEDEMRSAYLDYAMSVIVGRALPDVRDGLKPVHRRVLFSMSENGLGPTRPYRKCASIVGDVMGNYHPHGDTAIYDALVRLAQEFSMRYELIDGQGNFGSIDDDSAGRDALLRRGRHACRDGGRHAAHRRPRRGHGARQRARRRPDRPRPPTPTGARLEGLPLGGSPDAARAHARGLRADGHAQPPGALPGRHARRPAAALEAARRALAG